ncbi:hypothetical protein Halru_3080 [Halovivax ruber XH-70]|uniref:Uncharacterized protein n=1 Tax=Halovivax ruber (strain DSM 18193 / JCM 13892 / XH-70) TaxID=797302 RepID=L0IHC7_HALRX|nr:hypothetical protein [Halovivax ruber]AGB17646.1 hypothetical protein Halru_3080 [Halovivax ruber XH-70]
MNGRQSRRAVLQAVAGSGVALGLAGCTSSIPGMGGDESSAGEPCSDAGEYVEAVVDGDAEAAIEYVPYEYDTETNREEVLEQYEPSDRQQERFDAIDVGFECEENRELDDSEIDDLDADLGDHEITAAHELSLTVTMSGEYDGEEIDEEQESTGIIVAIDGDGWYIWEE